MALGIVLGCAVLLVALYFFKSDMQCCALPLFGVAFFLVVTSIGHGAAGRAKGE